MSTKSEIHLVPCSNSSRTVISAHQTFQVQGNVENSEDSKGKDFQGPRHDELLAEQHATSQFSEGTVCEIQEEDVPSPFLIANKENLLFFLSYVTHHKKQIQADKLLEQHPCNIEPNDQKSLPLYM